MNTHSCILCEYNSQEKLTFVTWVIYIILILWIWIIAVNHPKTSKFNKAFEFSMISSYYSYNIHYNMFLLVSHYPVFLITSCTHAFENYVQSIVLYGLSSWVIYYDELSSNTACCSDIFEKYFRKFWELFRKFSKIIPENFE